MRLNVGRSLVLAGRMISTQDAGSRITAWGWLAIGLVVDGDAICARRAVGGGHAGGGVAARRLRARPARGWLARIRCRLGEADPVAIGAELHADILRIRNVIVGAHERRLLARALLKRPTLIAADVDAVVPTDVRAHHGRTTKRSIARGAQLRGRADAEAQVLGADLRGTGARVIVDGIRGGVLGRARGDADALGARWGCQAGGFVLNGGAGGIRLAWLGRTHDGRLGKRDANDLAQHDGAPLPGRGNV